MEMTSLIDKMALQSTNHSKYVEGFGRVNGIKGYCVPNIMIEDNQKIQSVGNYSACAEDLTAFETIPCHDMRMSNIGGSKDGHPKRRENTYCLDAKDIVKLTKCGDGWEIITNGSSCICSLVIDVWMFVGILVFFSKFSCFWVFCVSKKIESCSYATHFSWIHFFLVLIGWVLLESTSDAGFELGWDHIFKIPFCRVPATWKKFIFRFQDFWSYRIQVSWEFCFCWWCNIHGSFSSFNCLSTSLGISYW